MLWEDMCSRWACFSGLCRSNHLSWCESRHLVFFFFLQLFHGNANASLLIWNGLVKVQLNW